MQTRLRPFPSAAPPIWWQPGGSLGSMLRAAVLTGNNDCYGAIYDRMRAVESKRRTQAAGRGAGKDQREQVAKIVASLFA